MKTNKIYQTLPFVFALLFTAPTSYAKWHHENQIDRFAEKDLAVWEGGQWRHEIRDRKLGWFWVVDDVYYQYEYPTYPNPYPYIPSPYLEQSQPPALDEPVTHSDNLRWFLCEDGKIYYPYTNSCASKWRVVTPPSADTLN